MKWLIALACLLLAVTPAAAATPNPPIYATGYIYATGGTTVVTNVINAADPNNLNILAAGPITTWDIVLPAAPFRGQIISIACPGGTVGTINLSSAGSASIGSGGLTSCDTGSGTAITYQFEIGSNTWLSLSNSGSSISLIAGTTTITGVCTNGYVLYNNSGVISCEAITGGGNVSSSGTPTAGQVAVWTNATTIEGLTTLPSGLTLPAPTITGSFTATGLVTNADLANSSTQVNGQACALGGSCTVTAAASSLTVGTTTIASGTSPGLLYNNSGVLGNLAANDSGVLVTSASGVPSVSSTLPANLTIPTPTFSTPTLTGATGCIGASAGGVLSGTGLACNTAAPIRVVSIAGSVTVTTADGTVVLRKSVGAATTVNLPSSPPTGEILTIKDGKGDAATNNITIVPASGMIDGLTTFVLTVAWEAAMIQYDGTQWDIL